MAKTIHPLLFIDLETTGHDPLKRVHDHLVLWHEIIDIGALLVEEEGLTVVGKFEKKVVPEHPERCLPRLVNNYNERAKGGEWATAASLGVAINELLGFAGKCGVVSIPGGQNWFFDWSFLSAAFAWCGISDGEWSKHLHYTRFDTRSMAIPKLLAAGEVYRPDEFSLRNGRLLTRLGLEPEPEVHEAINGAKKALEVYQCLRGWRKNESMASGKVTIEIFAKIIRRSWSRDTAYPPSQKEWNRRNPAFGHCLVTSLVVQKIFGGDFCFCKHQNHFWNRLENGQEIDLTCEQFPPGVRICADSFFSRGELLADTPESRADGRHERYQLLEKRVMRLLRKR